MTRLATSGTRQSAATVAAADTKLEGWTVLKRWTIVALLAISGSGITGACAAGQTTSSAQAVAAVTPSPSTAAATPAPTPTASPVVTPEPTATPAPTPSPTPVPWVTYKSKLFKYSIKHPPDWIVTPGSSDRTDLIDDFDAHYVYLERDTVATWVDIKGTVDQEKAFYKSHYKAKLISDKKVSVGALSGRLLTFNGSEDGRKFRIQHLIIARGKVGYFVTMFSDPGNEKADAKLFLRMYNSFKPTS
jgi:hypothetical protein